MTRTSTRPFERVAPTRWISPLSEEPQQQALHPRAGLADFVHEHGAAVRHFEHADAIAIGAGEAAALVAEQLALEERFGDGRAVDRDERIAAPRAPGVNQTGDDFLPDPALAGDEDLRVRSGG